MASTNDATNVGVGMPMVDGAIFIADRGTAIPTDPLELLGDLASFKGFGYVSTDGVTISEDSDSNEIQSWGGKTVKVIRTSYKETATFTPIEINETVLAEQYGSDNVTTTTAPDADGAKKYTVITSKHRGVTMPEKVLVIKTCPTDEMTIVYVAEHAQLTEKGDLALDGENAQGREMTYTCNAGSDGTTITSYVFGATVAGPLWWQWWPRATTRPSQRPSPAASPPGRSAPRRPRSSSTVCSVP